MKYHYLDYVIKDTVNLQAIKPQLSQMKKQTCTHHCNSVIDILF